MNDRIEEIKARCEVTTPGRWKWEADILLTSDPTHLVLKPYYDDDDYTITICVMPEDAEFIAHAREDIPFLLAEIERLTAERDEAIRFIPRACMTCKNSYVYPCGGKFNCGKCKLPCACKHCEVYSAWEWRGVQK